MSPLNKILKQAERLPPAERRKLVAKLERSLAPPKRKRTRKPRPAKDPYALSLALAGTASSDYTDVSSDKYKHLAEIYYDNHENE